MLYGRRMLGWRGRPIKGAGWLWRGTRDGRRVGEREEATAAPRDGGGRREHCECLPCSAIPLPPSRSLCGARSLGLALPGAVGLGADAALEVLVGCSSLPCARVPLVPT